MKIMMFLIAPVSLSYCLSTDDLVSRLNGANLDKQVLTGGIEDSGLIMIAYHAAKYRRINQEFTVSIMADDGYVVFVDGWEEHLDKFSELIKADGLTTVKGYRKEDNTKYKYIILAKDPKVIDKVKVLLGIEMQPN